MQKRSNKCWELPKRKVPRVSKVSRVSKGERKALIWARRQGEKLIMTRVKRGLVSRRKHKKLLSITKGFRGTKSKLVKVAKEAALHQGQYAFQGRKNRKRDFRALWILRIGEAAKQEGISYSVLMNKLKKSNIELDRKTLSNIILNDTNTFKQIVASVK